MDADPLDPNQKAAPESSDGGVCLTYTLVSGEASSLDLSGLTVVQLSQGPEGEDGVANAILQETTKQGEGQGMVDGTQPQQQIFLQLDPAQQAREETHVFSSVVATVSQSLLTALPGLKEVVLQELCPLYQLVLLSDADNNFFSVSGSLENVTKFGKKLKIFLGSSHSSEDPGSDKENEICDVPDSKRYVPKVDIGVSCDLLRSQVTTRGRHIRKPQKYDYSYVEDSLVDEEQDSDDGKKTQGRKRGRQSTKLLGSAVAKVKEADTEIVKEADTEIVKVKKKEEATDGNSEILQLAKSEANVSKTSEEKLMASVLPNDDSWEKFEDNTGDLVKLDGIKDEDLTESQKIRKMYELRMPFKYFCKLCSFKSKRESHFLKHKVLHAENPDLPILHCGSCDFKCIRSSVLQKHQLKHSDSQQVIKCRLCKFVSNDKKRLQIHMNTKHSIRNQRPQRPSLYCYVTGCKFETKFPLKLQKHLKVHGLELAGTGIKTDFQCDICNYKTSKKEHLARHCSNVHSDRRPYLCDLCGMTFKRRDTLCTHKHTHLERSQRTLPVKCPHCNKGFKSPAHLREHQSVHSNARTYLCHICGAAFKTLRVQKKHIKSIHVSPGAFSCDVCSKAFNTKHAMQRHCRTHMMPLTDTSNQEQQQQQQQQQSQDVTTVTQVNIDDINGIQTISINPEQLSQLTAQTLQVAVSGAQEGFVQDVISVPSIDEALEQGDDIRQYNIQANEATTALLYLTNMQTSVDVDNM